MGESVLLYPKFVAHFIFLQSYKKKENWSENSQSLPAHVVLHRHPSFKSTVILTGDFD